MFGFDGASLWILGVLGSIALWLIIPKKKEQNDPDEAGVSFEDIQQLADTFSMTEMSWVRLKVPPEKVTEVLNVIEENHISVMYQFFLRGNSYDMFFRCKKDKVGEFEEFMKDYLA